MILNYIFSSYSKFVINEQNRNQEFIIYNDDRFVYHITSKTTADKIVKDGFKTAKELNISEKRGAIYFSDKDVNYGLYARNLEGELYEGDDIGMVKINLKSLKLINMNYKDNYKLYKVHM